MIDIEKQNRIVELLGKGKSQRTVADELGIGLQTVVRWERELKEQIENVRVTEFDALLERYQLTVQAQIERYGIELARVTEELQKRDLADVPTPKLYDIMAKLHARVEEVRPTLIMRDDDEIADQKELRELIASRRNRKASAVKARAGREGNGDSTVRADDLVTQLLATLQRYKAGEIDGPTAANEMAIVNSIFKGIDVADLQDRLERVEIALSAEHDAR
jgi:transposase